MRQIGSKANSCYNENKVNCSPRSVVGRGEAFLTFYSYRTKTIEENRMKMKVMELEMFVDQLNKMSIKIKEASQVRQLLEDVKAFKAKATELINDDDPNIDHLKALLNTGLSFEVSVDEVWLLQKVNVMMS